MCEGWLISKYKFLADKYLNSEYSEGWLFTKYIVADLSLNVF